MFNILAHNKLIDFALEHSGLGHLDSREQLSFLGEGAWHTAYLFTDKYGEKFVIRFPKDVSAYGNKVDFDENAMLAEYRGTELYYEAANKVRPGICPEFYHFSVAPGKTYTIETFKGKTVNFAEITLKDAFNIGFQMGEFFREMNQARHHLKGFGYLTWNGSEVEGQFQTDLAAFIKEENEEIYQDFETLAHGDKRFNTEDIKCKLKDSLASRNISHQTLSFTNQDCSPENILFTNGKVSVIDPYPILYYGHSLAGNFMNCYEAIFPAYYNTKRYAKHQFNKFITELNEISIGFLQGYADGDPTIKQRVRHEQYIKLADLTYEHYQAATGELSQQMEAGMGTKDAIINRLSLYLQMLQEFKLD